MEPLTTVMDTAARRWFLLLGLLLLAILLVNQLRPVLSPFVVGGLIAYLGDPLADRLQRLGCSRALAATLVFAMIGALVLMTLLVTIPLLAQQLDTLVHKLPAMYEWFAGVAVPWVQHKLDLPQQQLPMLEMKEKLAENWQSVGKLVASAGAYITGSGINFMISLGNLVLIPVVAFYLLRDWDKLVPKALGLLPVSWQPGVADLFEECDEVIGAFLRGQFLVMLALGCIYAAGLWAVGLELAFLIGVVAGLASVVPYLGTFVGVILASVAALVQFQEWGVLLWVGLVFGVGQMIEGYLLTPILVGDRIGLHPVAVIFAILAGGQLAGFVGILVALPVAAVVMVFLRHVHGYYMDSDLYEDVDSPGG
ncbi:MAG: AI-2E family transporter [Gammaproteobacteria bacterium]|nr:AI-2E family transporter [Gammaproteobacteria bacterium]